MFSRYTIQSFCLLDITQLRKRQTFRSIFSMCGFVYCSTCITNGDDDERLHGDQCADHRHGNTSSSSSTVFFCSYMHLRCHSLLHTTITTYHYMVVPYHVQFMKILNFMIMNTLSFFQVSLQH